jgi:dipeptidyl-peptidase-4
MSAGAFPRRFARSGRFRLGEPGEFAVSPDGRRVAFLRSESGTDPRGAGPLPVLLDPYGGPGSQRVLAARLWWFGVSQWFAEQGFAVVVTDGRGTPGRGPVWDRAIRGDIAGPVLEDQITALHDLADRYPDIDLRRVGIRGWSFGGFLAALAVLRRPDVFHAAVAGAALSDHRLYDTYWKERHLGHPGAEPENYRRCSLLPEASKLARPLLLIHGLADDNVFAANTLRLSAALLAAGRPHTVLPLSGMTHLVAQPQVRENLPGLELDFLRNALGMTPGPPRRQLGPAQKIT